MVRRKGKFLTFCFSMLPGAGHMYLGFLKQGISLMSIFFGICFLSSWFHLGPLLFILPVLWFYSFFDAMNKNSLRDEDFYALEDNYLFNMDFSELKSLSQGKFRMVIALGFIFLGASIIFSNFQSLLYYILPNAFYNRIIQSINRLPQLVIAVFIIWIGIRLINGKKEELSKDDFEMNHINKNAGRYEKVENHKKAEAYEKTEDCEKTEGCEKTENDEKTESEEV